MMVLQWVAPVAAEFETLKIDTRTWSFERIVDGKVEFSISSDDMSKLDEYRKRFTAHGKDVVYVDGVDPSVDLKDVTTHRVDGRLTAASHHSDGRSIKAAHTIEK